VRVTRGREADRPSELRGPTFTGDVWAEPVLATGDGVIVNTVFFTPGARTHWHHHEHGQVLLVTHGRGYVQVRRGDGTWVRAGDTVWFPAGEEHWHGAGPDTWMAHNAVSLGTTEWLDPVTDEDYDASVGSSS
jgi:quercetin dioxygenase-like cupin family protein